MVTVKLGFLAPSLRAQDSGQPGFLRLQFSCCGLMSGGDRILASIDSIDVSRSGTTRLCGVAAPVALAWHQIRALCDEFVTCDRTFLEEWAMACRWTSNV